MKIQKLSVIYIGLVFLGCTTPAVTEQELKAYILIEENGLVQRSTSELLEVSCYYRPVDLVIAQKVYGEATTQTLIDSLRTEHQGLHYFVMHLASNGKEVETRFASDPVRYNEVVNYLNDYVGADLRMITASDTLAPVQTLYTPALGASNHTSLLVVFEASELGGDILVTWNDTGISRSIHEFTFSRSNIISIPKLIF